MSISIKISEENHRKLSKLSGRLREEFERPVSLNDAITHLCKKRRIGDLAGSWDMSKKEKEAMFSGLHKGWSTWKSA